MIKLLNKLSTNICSMVNNACESIGESISESFPRQCLLCNSKVYGINICYYCEKSLEKLNHNCYKCGWPIPRILSSCQMCVINDNNNLNFCFKPKDIKIALSYSHPIDRLIAKFKYDHDLTTGRLLGELLLKHLVTDSHYVSNELPEVIIPVPIHDARLKQRGFNQSIELAKFMAKNLDISFDGNLIAKYKATKPQMGQDRVLRQTNIADSFCFNRKPKYKSVVIIDDVVTTGSTVYAVANLLKQANIDKIALWAVARRY